MGTPRFLSLPREVRNAIYECLIPDRSFVELVPDQPWDCRGAFKDHISPPDRLCSAYRKTRLQRHASPEIQQQFEVCEVCKRIHGSWGCIDPTTLNQQRQNLLNTFSLATTCRQVRAEVMHEFYLRVDFHISFDLQAVQRPPRRFTRERPPILACTSRLPTYHRLASGVLPHIKKLSISVGLDPHEDVDSGLKQTSLIHVELELLLRTGFITQFTSLRQLTILRFMLLRPGATDYRGDELFLNHTLLSMALDRFQHNTGFIPRGSIFAKCGTSTPLQHLQELDERLKSLLPQVNTRICKLKGLPLNVCPDRDEMKENWYPKFAELKCIEAFLLRDDVDKFMEPHNREYRRVCGWGPNTRRFRVLNRYGMQYPDDPPSIALRKAADDMRERLSGLMRQKWA